MADDKVKKLIDEVTRRKKEIDSVGAYSFKTNMQLKLFGQNFNLQTLDIGELLNVYAQLALVAQKGVELAKSNGVDFTPSFSGFSFDKWQQDIQHKLVKLSLSKKQAELDKLEERLNKLISPELRAQLELAAIEKELGL